MVQEKKPIGMLNGRSAENKFSLSLHPPSAHIALFVEHYWIIRWDLRGQEPFYSQNLPHPSVHIVFEKDNSRIVGVVTGKFGYLVKDQGVVFGVKFWPGAFYPLMKRPVSTITDVSVPVDAILGPDSLKLEADVLSQPTDKQMVAVAESFLTKHLPQQDATIALVRHIHEAILTDRELIKVADVAERFQMSTRSLQRLFDQYVGVNPKWIIQRCRLHDVAEKVVGNEKLDWLQLALELGYHDQSHLIKDFKAIIGVTPEEYAMKIKAGTQANPSTFAN
ncbi:UNVERIFIED_CONTAM: AraC-like DNA-binding protein [Brevibacillus sp. OAP136]